MLQIAEGLSLPIDAVTAKLAWFGENGAGKTYAAMKLAEQMWDAGAQFVAFDPVGVWYGLRVGVEDSGGLPIAVFGGLNGDIPIRPQDGSHVAEVIVVSGISAVIDVSQFESDYAKAQFASDFAERFYFLKKSSPGAVHLFLEEAQEFVAESPSGGKESKDTLMANRFQRIWKIGRNYGIGGSLISQRPQEISKKALNLSGAVFVFRLTGPHERDYMSKWLAGYGDKIDLPSIATGVPYLWSPSWLKHSEFVNILPKRTQDISATPVVGESVGPRALTPVAIDALREKFAAVEADEAEHDPKKLQARIKDLEKQLRDSEPSEAQIEAIRKEAQAPLLERIEALNTILGRAHQMAHHLVEAFSDQELIKKAVGFREEFESTPLEPEPVSRPSGNRHSPPRADAAPTPAAVAIGDGSTGLTKSQLRIVEALASFHALGKSSADRRVVAALSGQSHKSGSYGQNLAVLRREALIETTGEGLALTDAGRAMCPKAKPPTLSELHGQWLSHLSQTQGRMLKSIIALHPKTVTRDELASLTNQSPKSGSFGQNLARLRSFSLVHGSKDIGATDLVFPGGLK